MQIVDLRGKLPVHKSKKYNTRKVSDIRSLAIHHSLTLSGSAQAFATYHVNTNGWPGIAYTYVIDKDGTINQCLDHSIISYHVGNSNKHALGICMVGDFRTQKPTDAQYKSVLELVRWLQSQLPNATSVLGHSQYPGYTWKACPVMNMDKFRLDVVMGDDKEMTESERKELDSLKQLVIAQTNTIRLLEKKIACLDAPKWFISEFGAEFIKNKISNPQMTLEGWRAVAIALRASK
ncbi:MAG: peptidoglycan recognition protein family protein [Candidatus Pristimantibacillus lignocellulolyticus]|uniref:Peptidoglycan recognition protein family protein n=1 Tax=Candidatus Pristimantibacillus lignocellulolyticus TaxID=2994561 RepID=A0A9J6ZEZ7_9BACL|nr:MAG: peptidoglycan recognition protein family protein [Candidatus Pristimantibacillus lignocellulolyticus]